MVKIIDTKVAKLFINKDYFLLKYVVLIEI